MNKCVIVGAGDVRPGDLSVKREKGDLFIAADAGYEHLIKNGVVPDLLIGDFDSMERPFFNGETVTLPVEKDDTDVGYAIKEGLRRGYKEFVIVGGLGGKRFSHSLANIQLLSYLEANSAHGTLLCGNTSVFIIRGEYVFDKDKKGSLSLFSLGECAEISVSGTKYDVERVVLKRDFPLGVSNSFVGKSGKVTVFSGEVLAITEE